MICPICFKNCIETQDLVYCASKEPHNLNHNFLYNNDRNFDVNIILNSKYRITAGCMTDSQYVSNYIFLTSLTSNMANKMISTPVSKIDYFEPCQSLDVINKYLKLQVFA